MGLCNLVPLCAVLLWLRVERFYVFCIFRNHPRVGLPFAFFLHPNVTNVPFAICNCSSFLYKSILVSINSFIKMFLFIFKWVWPFVWLKFRAFLVPFAHKRHCPAKCANQGSIWVLKASRLWVMIWPQFFCLLVFCNSILLVFILNFSKLVFKKTH